MGAACILFPSEKRTRRGSKADVLLGLGVLTGVAVTMRFEIAALLGPLALQALVLGNVNFLEAVVVGSLALVISACALVSIRAQGSVVSDVAFLPAATVLVDSYMWSSFPLWPELASVVFNVFRGKSAEWGVSVSGFRCALVPPSS
jgi:alpha-1,6-mannosyltransferase